MTGRRAGRQAMSTQVERSSFRYFNSRASWELTAGRYILLTALLTAGLLIAACVLPHDRAMRFHSLSAGSVVKAGWIYDRIHFDPAATDVVFVGSSHTVFGVDAALTASKFNAVTGQNLRMVNFAMQHPGRNVPWLLAREVLRARTVRLLVIEVQEDEPRALHPAFGSLADVADIVAAPLLVNTSFAADFAQLPQRQARLFAASLAMQWFGQDRDFDRAAESSDWDDTAIEGHVPGAMPRIGTRSVAELEAQRQYLNSTVQAGGWFSALEHRCNLIYLDKILQLAEARHIPIRFLYMPEYAVTSPPHFAAHYRAHGPILFPQEVYQRREFWLDVAHLNRAGAQALAAWLGMALAADTSLQRPAG